MNRQTLNSEQARIQWRNLLDLASRGDTDIIIERHGQPTAAVLGYRQYRLLLNELEHLRTRASAEHRGPQMAAALEQLAQLPNPLGGTDPLEWQHEQRRERTLRFA